MKTTTLFSLAAIALTASVNSQEEDRSAELAKQRANPVASLISAPFQGNWDFGIGPNDAARFTLNVQPVIPFGISDDWSLIVRTIVSVIDAESPAPGIDDASGLGDTMQSFFFSPKEPVDGACARVSPFCFRQNELTGLTRFLVSHLP